MNTGTTVDLMELVDAYILRTGRVIDERTRLNCIYGNPAWLKRYPAWKAAQKKQALQAERPKQTTPAVEIAMADQWLAEENQRRKDYNASLTTGTGLPMLEIGYSNGQITTENAIHAAKLAHEEKQAAYDDQVLAAGRARQQYVKAENERANNVLARPIDPNAPVYQKYKAVLVPLSDEAARRYESWSFEDLSRQIAFAKHEVELTIGKVQVDEFQKAASFLQVNELDPGFAANWGAAIAILVELQVVRRKDLGPVTVDIKAPEMPQVAERPAAETRPQGRAQEQLQRENDTLRDIRAAFGSYLDEVNSKQAEPVAAPILFRAFDQMLQTRQEINRESVRKYLFQSALQFGQKLDGFGDDEIESFNDQAEMRQVSAEEAKRQLSIYGDVRLSRVPDKQTALLEQLVKQTARKS